MHFKSHGISARWFRVVLVVAVTLAGVEGGVRLLGIAPPLMPALGNNVADPVLPFRVRPSSILKGRWHTGEFDFEFRQNALGFRDQERVPEKPVDVFRIAALGDSFTYGIGAAFDETWPSRLEGLLESALPESPVEVLSFGLPRYFPAAERLILEHVALDFDPDLVIVGVLPNDVVDTHLGIEAIRVDDAGFLRSKEGQRLGEVGRELYLRSHAARIVLRSWVAHARNGKKTIRWEDVYLSNGRHEDDWRRLEADLDAMLALTTARDIPLVVLSIPQKGPWEARHHYPDERLAAWSARRGVHFVPTLDALARVADDRVLYWEIDGHCNAEGYAVVAETLYDALLRWGLAPSPASFQQ
jgi:lysophospholipase L1-like esterase